MSFLTHASAHAQAYVPASTHEITAAQYCDFLNQNAAIDPNNLFDQKMEADPETACIVRLGTPGNYFYEVIAGRENFPMTYVNEAAQQKYCNWLQNGTLVDTEATRDSYLKSNKVGFQVTASPGTQLLMFGPEAAAAGVVEESTAIEVAETVGTVVAGALLADVERAADSGRLTTSASEGDIDRNQ